MACITCYWDDANDPDGNVQHIAEHDLTPEEIEEVLDAHYAKWEPSRTSGHPIVFGTTSTGRHIAVVFDIVDEDEPAVYPRTAYDVPQAVAPKKRRKKR